MAIARFNPCSPCCDHKQGPPAPCILIGMNNYNNDTDAANPNDVGFATFPLFHYRLTTTVLAVLQNDDGSIQAELHNADGSVIADPGSHQVNNTWLIWITNDVSPFPKTLGKTLDNSDVIQECQTWLGSGGSNRHRRLVVAPAAAGNLIVLPQELAHFNTFLAAIQGPTGFPIQFTVPAGFIADSTEFGSNTPGCWWTQPGDQFISIGLKPVSYDDWSVNTFNNTAEFPQPMLFYPDNPLFEPWGPMQLSPRTGNKETLISVGTSDTPSGAVGAMTHGQNSDIVVLGAIPNSPLFYDRLRGDSQFWPICSNICPCTETIYKCTISGIVPNTAITPPGTACKCAPSTTSFCLKGCGNDGCERLGFDGGNGSYCVTFVPLQGQVGGIPRSTGLHIDYSNLAGAPEASAYLSIGSQFSDATYSLPLSQFNCTGDNTFTLLSSINSRCIYPATATVNYLGSAPCYPPVGFDGQEFQFCPPCDCATQGWKFHLPDPCAGFFASYIQGFFGGCLTQTPCPNWCVTPGPPFDCPQGAQKPCVPICSPLGEDVCLAQDINVVTGKPIPCSWSAGQILGDASGWEANLSIRDGIARLLITQLGVLGFAQCTCSVEYMAENVSACGDTLGMALICDAYIEDEDNGPNDTEDAPHNPPTLKWPTSITLHAAGCGVTCNGACFWTWTNGAWVLNSNRCTGDCGACPPPALPGLFEGEGGSSICQ